MHRNQREVKKEVELMLARGEIEDYRFGYDARHPLITFLHRGTWHSIPFGATPRTEFGNNYVRQQIRRKIRSMAA